MAFDKYSDRIIIPIIFPNPSKRKEKWVCAYLDKVGRVTVPESRFKELLKEGNKVIRIESWSD